MSEYLGEAVVHLDVRPIRAAYLMRPGSAKDFKRAVYHACGRWGGLRETIVPINARGKVAPGYRWLVESGAPPDVFVDLAGLSDKARDVVQMDFGKPVIPKSFTETPNWEVFHVLGAHTVEALGQINVLAPLRPALVDRAANGLVEDPEELRQWEALGARVEMTADRVALAVAQLTDRTVLATTLHQCDPLLIQSPFTMTQVWVARPNSLPDCLGFWNVRAATPSSVEQDYIILTTPDIFANPRFQEVFVGALRRRPHVSTPSFLLRSVSLPRSELEQLARDLSFEIYTGPEMNVHHHFGRGQGRAQPPTLSVGINRTVGLPRRTLYGVRASPTVQLFTEGTRIRTASPLHGHPLYGFGPIRVRLSGPPQLTAPKSPSVARLFEPTAEWVLGELDVPMRHGGSFDIPIAIPPRRAVLEAALHDRGLTFQFSQPGKHSQAVLGRLSSPELFLNPNVAKVIGALTSKPPAKLLDELTRNRVLTEEQATEILARLDVRPPRIERQGREIRHSAQIPLTDVLSILDDLAFAGLVERGLVVECDHCGLATFSVLRDVNANAVCPACGGRGRLAGDSTGAQIYYRLHALLDRASAVGAIGHLYAVAAILLENRSAVVIPGADIVRQDGSTEEVDLLGLSGDLLFAGEVKQSAGWFTRNQIERDLRLTAELGAKRHLMAALTPLSQRTIDLAAQAAKHRRLGLTVLDPPTNRLRIIVNNEEE